MQTLRIRGVCISESAKTLPLRLDAGQDCLPPRLVGALLAAFTEVYSVI